MADDVVTLFLAGDVMTGRGIDQVLPHPSAPDLFEDYVKSARDYVALAETANGPIRKPVDFSYVWGDALAELDRVCPDARIVNLETSVTGSDAFEPKGINYRMSPDNISCLTALGIDACALANNHVLDWGEAGLVETLETLAAHGLKTAGAGRTAAEAQAPAVLDLGAKGRVLVFAFGVESSGVPLSWAAKADRAGINLLHDLSDSTLAQIAARIRAAKRPRDVVVASIHWGGNWGYDVPDAQRRFAHGLIDEAGVDVVHGHSSHHPKGIEVYRDRPILYGCGDFIDDYEGISGYEAYRDDLVLMYLATVDAGTGQLIRLAMTPLQIRKFSLHHASSQDAAWLRDVIDCESVRFGAHVILKPDNRLEVAWQQACS